MHCCQHLPAACNFVRLEHESSVRHHSNVLSAGSKLSRSRVMTMTSTLTQMRTSATVRACCCNVPLVAVYRLVLHQLPCTFLTHAFSVLHNMPATNFIVDCTAHVMDMSVMSQFLYALLIAPSTAHDSCVRATETRLGRPLHIGYVGFVWCHLHHCARAR